MPLSTTDQPAGVIFAALAARSDLIVRGQVSRVHSFWTDNHTMIASDVTIAVRNSLLGAAQNGAAQNHVVVRTAGGYLPAEGLGMLSPHAANFTPGEEVLVVLQKQGGIWEMVDGAAGKFLLQDGVAVNYDLALAQPVDRVLSAMAAAQRLPVLQSQLPRHDHPFGATAVAPATETTPAFAGSLYIKASAESRKWPTPHAGAPYYLNLNTVQVDQANGSSADFRNAVMAAAASWGAVAGVDFKLNYAGTTAATQTGYDGVNEILFMHKGNEERAAAAQVWYTSDATIVEADIWINDDYTWDATGAPAADEVDLQSALLHEFGHWLILGHFTDAKTVMYPRLTTGTLKRELQKQDQIGIRTIYPQ
ncbi:MAG: matrixin family metalloprotease [Caldilineaceae bacterium]